MNNTLFGNLSLQNIGWVLFPLMLLYTGKNNLPIKLNLDSDLQGKVDMLEKVTPYFSGKDQLILYKVHDILDIVNKINRVRESSYSPEINSLSTEFSSIEKKQKILEEVFEHVDGRNKKLIDKVLDTKYRIDETKNNLENYTQKASTTENRKIDSMFELAKCFMPVLQDDSRDKIDKFEKVIKILQSTVEK